MWYNADMKRKVIGAYESVTNSEQTRQLLNRMTDYYNERERKIIQAAYDDDELHRTYGAIREKNSLTPMHSKNKVHRELIRFPNPEVADFVKTTLSIKYGHGWTKDKKTVKKICKSEPLIKPWVLYPSSKI